MEDKLADKQQMVVILRLTLDEQRRLLHGEVVDLEGKLLGRFADWRSLTSVVRTWVTNLETNSTES